MDTISEISSSYDDECVVITKTSYKTEVIVDGLTHSVSANSIEELDKKIYGMSNTSDILKKLKRDEIIDKIIE